jgi:Fungal N-terminal domain of STAND proteins
MADPLSITASIVAVVQVSAIVLKSLGDLKDTPRDLRRLRTEIDNLQSVLLPALERLRRPEEEKLAPVQLLSAQGPLEEFRTLLEHLKKKLAPAAGLNKARRAVTWQFQKGEIQNILGAIERQKSLFALSLQTET